MQPTEGITCARKSLVDFVFWFALYPNRTCESVSLWFYVHSSQSVLVLIKSDQNFLQCNSVQVKASRSSTAVFS